MTNVVIVDAVRTPIGRRGGGLASVHPAELLSIVQKGLIDRTGIDPALVNADADGAGRTAVNVTSARGQLAARDDRRAGRAWRCGHLLTGRGRNERSAVSEEALTAHRCRNFRGSQDLDNRAFLGFATKTGKSTSPSLAESRRLR